jgi:hypothetical protein
MVPLENLEHEHAKSALQFIILLLTYVVDLLGDRHGVNFRQPARAQEFGLMERPGIKVVAFRRGAWLLPNNGSARCCLPRPQLKAMLSALSGSS